MTTKDIIIAYDFKVGLTETWEEKARSPKLNLNILQLKEVFDGGETNISTAMKN